MCKCSLGQGGGVLEIRGLGNSCEDPPPLLSGTHARVDGFRYSVPRLLSHPNSTLCPCHWRLAVRGKGGMLVTAPRPGPAGLKARRGLVDWLILLFLWGLCSIDWARSQTPASDGNRGKGVMGGWQEVRVGGRQEEGLPPCCLTFFFPGQVVLISDAYVYQSMNLRRHGVSASF